MTVILQFCNTARESSKMKKPLTLEKDKGSQSKYYLRYAKPPVLDMKWENHNINVVEWENIPKFPLLLSGD